MKIIPVFLIAVMVLVFDNQAKSQFVDTIIIKRKSIEKANTTNEVFVPVIFQIGFFNGKLMPGGQIELEGMRIPLDARKGKQELFMKKGDYRLGGYHPSGISPLPITLKIEEGYCYEIDIYLRPSGKPIVDSF